MNEIQEHNQEEEYETISFDKRMWFLGDVNAAKDEYMLQIAEYMDKISKKYHNEIENVFVDCDCEQLNNKSEFAFRVTFRYKKKDKEKIIKLLNYIK